MKLLVTGATGFLGPHVVRSAISRGHDVRALVRAGAKGGLPAACARVPGDLRQRAGLVDALRAGGLGGVDAVLHLAAAKSGDLYAQFAGTVLATENLLWAMREAGVDRIVLVSSFSVYDYLAMRSGTLLDEESPLEARPEERDPYCQTKLLQERLVREARVRATILRPGAIWGATSLWSARLGAQSSSTLWFRTGANAAVPLTYVENCAEAIVLAAERVEAVGQTINLVDDDCPTQARFARELARRASPVPRIVPVPWTALRALARAAWAVNVGLLGGKAKVPALLRPGPLHARCKPLRFTNEKARRLLGWRPRWSLAEALDRAHAPPLADEPGPAAQPQPKDTTACASRT